MAIGKKKLSNGKFVFYAAVMDVDRKWFPRKYFHALKEAKVFESTLVLQKSRGVKSLNTHEPLTLSKYYHETYKVLARTKVSQGQRNTENQLFRDHVAPYIGGLKVTGISKLDIAKLLADLETEKQLGSSQLTHVYNLLNQMFSYSIEVSDLRDANPVLKRFKPEPKDYVPAYMKPERARDFLDIVKDHWLGPVVWIMAGSALRVGEVIGLQHGDIDLENRTIHLRRAWRRKESQMTEIKNKKAEKATPINVDLAEYLKRRLSKTALPTDWVIQSKRYPGKMASYHTIYKDLKILCQANGVPHVSPHGWRHTASGLWNEIGAERRDLMDIYNHSDEATTQRYNHEVPDRLHELGKRVKMSKATSTSKKTKPVLTH